MNESQAESGAEQVSPPHGWYPDPASDGRQRLWDGTAWTDQVRLPEPDQPGPDGPVSFLPPGAEPDERPAVEPAAARSSYGTPIDFRGQRLAPPPRAERVPIDNPKGPTGGVTADGVPLASWGERMVATVVDTIINLALLAVLLPFVATDFYARYLAELQRSSEMVLAGQASIFDHTPELLHLSTVLTMTQAAVSIIYGTLLIGLGGATLGQRLLRLTVVPFGRGRDRVTLLQALLRTAIWTALAQGGSIILLVQMFSLLLPLWHPHKQTVHDVLARTQVVKSPPTSSAQP